jgi:hypothetical protein
MFSFSPNPYTRRRQLLVTALAAASGVVVALTLVSSLRNRPRLIASKTVALDPASFGTVALSPDGTRQVELRSGHVVLRDRQTQLPVAIFSENNIKGARFTPGGSEVLIHVLKQRVVPGQELAQLTDHVVVLDPITGQKKGEGPYTLTR